MPPSSSSSPDVDLSRADLLSLGTVCASPGCGTRDFLPFRCSFCAGVFCLEHRRDHGGACGPASARVLVCPVCARAVKLPPSKGSERELTEEAAAAAFDAHARSKVSRNHKERERERGKSRERTVRSLARGN
jgi:hypothetical protein